MGAFSEVFGNTINNRILEYILENQDLDFAVSDIVRELKISKPKAYEVIREFEKLQYVKKSRIIGKTQLYRINKNSKRMRLFKRIFKYCLRLIAEEQGINPEALISEKALANEWDSKEEDKAWSNL